MAHAIWSRVGLAEPTFAVALGANRDAVRTLHLRLDGPIDKVDGEHRAMRAFDDAMRDGVASTPRPMHAKSPADDEMGIELGGERDDLFVRFADTNVKTRVPVGPLADVVEALEHETRERELGVFARGVAVVVDDVDEVEVRGVVARGLVERVLEDNLGVLGEVERDDDAEGHIALHMPNEAASDVPLRSKAWQ